MGPFGRRRRPEPPQLADYYSSERDLYRVEQVARDRALVEDCLTGALIDVPIEYLARLRPIRPRGTRVAA